MLLTVRLLCTRLPFSARGRRLEGGVWGSSNEDRETGEWPRGHEQVEPAGIGKSKGRAARPMMEPFNQKGLCRRRGRLDVGGWFLLGSC